MFRAPNYETNRGGWHSSASSSVFLPFTHLSWCKAHRIVGQTTTQSPTEIHPRMGLSVTGENMMGRAMLPNPRQFLPLRKVS